MQAYASAQAAPVGSESQLSSRPPMMQGEEVADIFGATGRTRGAESASAAIAALILDGLDDHGLASLARRLLPHLRQRPEGEERSHVAYTVASLASELDVSQKAIRCAIARRELAAVKRGSRWIISADAVLAWATASDQRCRGARVRGKAAPKAAGPSLRAILCEAAGGAGAR
jgi:excisionase family DNA binding protein